jgi:hypothetical protein
LVETARKYHVTGHTVTLAVLYIAPHGLDTVYQVTPSHDISELVEFGTVAHETVDDKVLAAVPRTGAVWVTTGVARGVAATAVRKEVVDAGPVPIAFVNVKLTGMVLAVADEYVCTYELDVTGGLGVMRIPSIVRFIPVRLGTGVQVTVTVPCAGVVSDPADKFAGARGAAGALAVTHALVPVRVKIATCMTIFELVCWLKGLNEAVGLYHVAP